MAREHNDGRLETVPAQDAHGFAAVDVGQADIHDHQIDLSLFGSLHALAAILCRESFKFLVQPKLLRQRVSELGIIVDDENLTRIRHPVRLPPSHKCERRNSRKTRKASFSIRGITNVGHQTIRLGSATSLRIERPSLWALISENIEFVNLRRFSEKIARLHLFHQGRRYLSVEMRVAAGLVIERVKYGE
jgi:hypothetical protein